MKPLISVIVPIYKVEAYLETCVDSILQQTYDHLEIILVDDGSPDRCGQICDEFALKDSRVRVIHKKNGGLSDARNAGLRSASGEYIYFVDSDDLLPLNSIEQMYSLAEQHRAEMVIGGFERFYDQGEVFFSTDADGVYVSVMNKEEAMKDFYRDGCQAWAVLYHKSVHRDIYFPVNEINEDEAIVFQLLERCNTVVVTNKVVYTYRNRQESITTSEFSGKKLIWSKHCKDNLEWIRKNHPGLEKDAATRYCISLMWSLTEMALSEQDFNEEIKFFLRELKSQKKLFKNLLFTYRQDKVRLWMLTNLPFAIYKLFIRMKRRG